MASVNDEQCKVFDIKFHAFQIPTFFFKSTMYFFKDMVSRVLDGIRKKESAFKKPREVRKRRSKRFVTVPIWNVDRNSENLGKKSFSFNVDISIHFPPDRWWPRGLEYQKSLQEFSEFSQLFFFFCFKKRQKRGERLLCCCCCFHNLSTGLWNQGSCCYATVLYSKGTVSFTLLAGIAGLI